MTRTYTQRITITAGSTFKEVDIVLPKDFDKMVAYGIPAPLNPASSPHNQNFTVSLNADTQGKVIQDETNGIDLLFTPNVPSSERYRKTDVVAKGNRVKVVAKIPAAIGSDFSFDLVFILV